MRWRPLQRRFVFEVVQSSSMDCGPAALKCVLEGFGVQVSYGRLREACQTSVDGTSIDVIEHVACELGMDAEQLMIPVDHLFIRGATHLPALAITVLPSGATHFVVVWSEHGPYVQVMDPAEGRRFIRKSALLEQLYTHQMPVPAEAWEEWARSEDFLDPLAERLAQLNVQGARALLDAACADEGPGALMRLDAAVRFLSTLDRRSLDSRARGTLLAALLALPDEQAHATIPASCWSARALPDEEGPSVLMRGAVLVSIKGVRAHEEAEPSPPRDMALERSLNAGEPSVMMWLLSLCWRHARGALVVLGVCGAMLAVGGILEALLMQELLVSGRELTSTMTRTGALVAFLILLLILWGAQLLHGLVARATGRQIEQRLRVLWHERLPWLKPQYFSSRLRSDMIERAHALSATRQSAHLIVGVWQGLLSMTSAALGLLWLAPELWGVITACLVALVILPWLAQPSLQESELRARVHAATRGQVVLDALLGSVPARAHGAQEDLRVEHEGRLVDWLRAERAQLRAQALVRGLQACAVASASALIVWRWWAQHGELTGALLLVYWAQRMGDGAHQLAMQLFDYPVLRNVMLRLHEFVHGERETPQEPLDPEVDRAGGMRLVMRECSARVAGHEVLRGLDAEIAPGEHVAIVGASGAGKSTLLKLIMGLIEDVEGVIELDGSAPSLWMASEAIAWVDAAGHLWNESILENVSYGVDGTGNARGTGEALEQAQLIEVLARSAHGMSSSVGEGGGMLSGGEGQRVRIARALMMWERARLVVLDEAFRGLERARREELLATLRVRSEGKTMVIVTHDIGMTTGFDRVWVLSDGELVEQGDPTALREQLGSHYRRLLDAEASLHERLWGHERWRVGVLQDGKLRSQHVDVEPALPGNPAVLLAQQEAREVDRNMFQFNELGVALRRIAAHVDQVSSPGMTGAMMGPVTGRRSEDVTRWLGEVSGGFGLESRGVNERGDRALSLVQESLPLILGCRDERGDLLGFKVAVSRRRRLIELLKPEGGSEWVALASLREAVMGRVELHESHMREALHSVGVESPLASQLAGRFVALRQRHRHSPTHWHVSARPLAQSSAWTTLIRPDSARWFVAMVSLGVLGYAMVSVGWWLLGRGSLLGEGSASLLLAWSGAVMTAALCVGLETWAGGELALRVAREVMTRVMDGALRMQELRRRGPGELMGQLYEAEGAMESLIAGGVMAMMGAIALVFASWVMAQGAGGAQLLWGLAMMCAVLVAGATRWGRALRRWTAARIGLTEVLVERMLGHTTRQLQRPRERWYEGEDELLATYHAWGGRMDRMSVLMGGLMSRGWVTLALMILAPVWIERGGVGVAISWGGVLLAAQGLSKLSWSMEALGRGWVAWGELGRFLEASRREERHGVVEALASEPSRGEVVLRGHGMVLRSGQRVTPVLKECEVVIRHGEQWLITGASGAGKSTLASVLAGERGLDSGVVVSRSGDREVLGERLWRREVMVVPQFHENHIFRGTLAMNVLLGQGWPAEPEALERCEEVLEALGMGEVLARMPGGLNQMVGESGWSLSHGERNRVFIARALLSDARVVIFDESFSALDPEIATQVLEVVRERLPTIMVIAHP